MCPLTLSNSLNPYSCPTGTGFGDIPSGVAVSINDSPCIVTSVADDKVKCTLGPNPAGSYGIEVSVADKGKASGSHDFEYELTLESLSMMEGTYVTFSYSISVPFGTCAYNLKVAF